MKLPHADQAFIPKSKVLYLLSEEKSGGKDKFFKGFGFSVAQWERLQMAILTHAQTNEVMQIVRTEFGVKYLIEGTLMTPDARNPRIRSVWQIDEADTVVRFVTAYPVQE